MIKKILIEFEKSGKFTSQEIDLDFDMTHMWVQFQIDPQRFLPKIFDGNWARPDKHPQVGKIRLLRIIKGNDGVNRLIGRQTDFIFATPWLG